MTGLVNFASQLGSLFAVFLPAFCYVGALWLFGFSAWGFWQQAQPHNPYRAKPRIPVLSLILCGVLASFDKFLTMANATAGSGIVVGLTSYSAPSAGSTFALGSSPADTIVNIVTLFELFFQAFGAMVCLFALLSWRSTVNGTSRRTQGGAVIQFIFGVMLINVVTVTSWLVSVLTV